MNTANLRDPDHMKKWYDQEGYAAADEIDSLRKTFAHYHVSNGKDDACKKCGLDLRNPIHCSEKKKHET